MDIASIGAAVALVKGIPGSAAQRAETAQAAAEAAAEQAEAAVTGCVSYTEQTGHTDAEKAQARDNIGAEGLSAVPQETNRSGEYISIPTSIGEKITLDENDEPTFTSNANARVYFTECEEGDAFTVSGVRASAATPLIAFIAEDGTLLNRSFGSQPAPLTVFRAPAGTKWMQFVRWSSGAASNNVLYIGAMTSARLDNLEAQQTVEEAVSGSEVTITAQANHRYTCSASALESLSFTPSATGLCEVIFTSGTTPTVLTLPQTVVMPDWWTGVEASRTYDIMIADGVRGVVMSWAT